MAIKTINLSSRVRHVPTEDPCYREDGKHLPGASVFILASLPAVHKTILSDTMSSYAEGGVLVMRPAENNLMAARMAIKGWENVDAVFEVRKEWVNGYELELVTLESINVIPRDIVSEIGRRVKQENQLSEEQEKNSVSASSDSNYSKNGTAELAQPEASSAGDATLDQSKTRPVKQ